MKKLTALITIVLATVTVSCGGSSTSSSEKSSASQSKFCSAFTEMATAFEKLDQDESSTGSEATEDTSQDEAQEILDTLIDKMVKEAPDAVKDETKIVADSLVKYSDLMNKLEFDDMGNPTDPEVQSQLEKLSKDPDITAAGETLNAYLGDECGIDINGTSTSGGDFCTRHNRYSTALMATGFGYDPEVPDSFKQVYTSVASAAESMLEVAPDEMRDPAQVLVDNAKDLLDYLESIDFDADRAGEDPDFKALDENYDAQSALGKIQTYCMNAAENG